jgi:hypothetical protein
MIANHPLKAITEIHRTLAEIQIVAIDCQAHLMALKSTVLEMGGQRAHEVFEKHLAEENKRLFAMRDERQKAAETFENLLQTLATAQGFVN